MIRYSELLLSSIAISILLGLGASTTVVATSAVSEAAKHERGFRQNLWGCEVRIPFGFMPKSAESPEGAVYVRSDLDRGVYEMISVMPDDGPFPPSAGPFPDFVESARLSRNGNLYVFKLKTRVGLEPVTTFQLIVSDGRTSFGATTERYSAAEDFFAECLATRLGPTELIWTFERNVQEKPPRERSGTKLRDTH